ncbi:MAG TPA: hypothetical protein VF221_14730 [Chloroflexota bacterium]
MKDEQFDQDFVWYEWGFVSPGEVPTDDLRVPEDDRQDGGPMYRASTVWEDEWRRWTT